MLGVPQHAYRRPPRQSTPDWWDRMTPAYLAGYIAYEVLHIPILDYLRLPESERQFSRAYLVAKNLKEKHRQDTQRAAQHHEQWSTTWRQSYGAHSLRG